VQLTPRQTAVLSAVEQLTAARGYPPTFAEIASTVGVCESRAKAVVDRLCNVGVLAREEASPRTIRASSKEHD